MNTKHFSCGEELTVLTMVLGFSGLGTCSRSAEKPTVITDTSEGAGS
jgi:hypothetical protein